MCGIIGVAGSIDRDAINAFNTLLVYNQVRGSHSTGVATVARSKNEVGVFKAVGPASNLQEFKRYDNYVSLGKSVIIGHGRHATVGEITSANAHPFDFPGVVGVHNGTIPWGAKSKLADYDQFGTDSEALYHNVNMSGVAETIAMLDDGAWALSFYDKVNHTINLLRNKNRPLCYALTKDEKQLWWASEGEMLYAALVRHGVEIEDLYALPEDELRTWDVPSWGEKFGDFAYTEVKQKEKAPQPSHFQGPRGYYRNGSFHSFTTSTKTTEKADEGTQSAGGVEDDGLPFAGGVSNTSSKAYGDNKYAAEPMKYRKDDKVTELLFVPQTKEKLNQRAFESRTHCTCSGCNEVVVWEDLMAHRAEVEFFSPDEFMCEVCSKDEWMRQWVASGQFQNGRMMH